MQVLTSLVLAAFCAYAGSWYLGLQEGNFALLLLMAVVLVGRAFLLFTPTRCCCRAI